MKDTLGPITCAERGQGGVCARISWAWWFVSRDRPNGVTKFLFGVSNGLAQNRVTQF